MNKLLWVKLAEHTAPECANSCRVPHSCCDELACMMTDEFARGQGVELPRTDHPRLWFMGPNGCAVEPHLRPLCTFHTCAINGIGFKPNDPAWTKKYFRLRHACERDISNI